MRVLMHVVEAPADTVSPEGQEGKTMPLMGSRIRAAFALLRGNPQPWGRRRLFGNRIAWGLTATRAWLGERRAHRSAPRFR